MLAENRSTPRSDEELQKLTVGELKPHNAPITIVEYDPSWPDLFEREANRIRSVLGTKALQIEHVGSTSVSILLFIARKRTSFCGNKTSV